MEIRNDFCFGDSVRCVIFAALIPVRKASAEILRLGDDGESFVHVLR